MSEKKDKPAVDPIARKKGLQLLAAGFGLTFIHLFWYGSPLTAWLAFFCYAPFIVWLQFHSRRPFLAGLTFGYFYALMNVYWLAQFVGRWTDSILVSAIVILVIGGVWGCFYGFACWLQSKVTFLRMGFVFGFLIFLMEMGRMNIPQLEFPFTPIGEPLVVYPIFATQFHSAAFSCLMVLVINGILTIPIGLGIAKVVREFIPIVPRFLPIFVPVVVVGLAVSWFSPRKNPVPLGIRVGLGQLGTDLAYGDERTGPARVAEAGNDLIGQAKMQKVDLLVLPEGITSFRTTPYTPFTLLPDMKVIFGAQRGTGPTYQSAFLWDGKAFSCTDKNRLVVFGEYVPFRNVIPYPKGFQLPSGDLAAGNERRLLQIKPGVTAGAMICFESLFPGAARDFDNLNASFLAIISLDDWYIGTNAIPRLQIAARWRAVETNKWIVRVGSLGKTMVIDPKGQVEAEIPTGERRLLIYEL